MKKLYLLLCVVFITSCTNFEEDQNLVVPNISQQNEIREKVSLVTSEILTYAYSCDCIDYNIAEDILNTHKPLNAEVIDFSQKALTRSDSSEGLEIITSNLSKKQLEIYNQICQMAINKFIDYDFLYKMISELDDLDEKNEMLIYVSALQAVQMGLEDVAMQLYTKSGWFGNFMCNVTAGGLGSIYGMWGAAIIGGATAATGGAAAIAGIIIGSAISTLIC